MCCVWVFCLHACRRNSCVSGVCGSQKDTGSLDLEWQMAVIHHVNFRRQTLGARTLLLQEEWVFLTTEPSLLAHHPVWFLLFKRKMYPLFSGNLVYRHIEFMFMIKTENALINFILHNIYIILHLFISKTRMVLPTVIWALLYQLPILKNATTGMLTWASLKEAMHNWHPLLSGICAPLH